MSRIACVLCPAFPSTTDCFTSAALYLFLVRHEQIKADSPQQFNGFHNLFAFFLRVSFFGRSGGGGMVGGVKHSLV